MSVQVRYKSEPLHAHLGEVSQPEEVRRTPFGVQVDGASRVASLWESRVLLGFLMTNNKQRKRKCASAVCHPSLE